ncbi:serine O-acetyltransferase [Bacteroides sp. ET336]|uniref:serine O-acetyltransferase n=1 Tax=Bacteroides sp. ET336 TaxID=2972459 RepID=UPI0021AD17F1|nr:DapH/DapD/GlmU-related protein [Bacteroides sp. ET336]MCR8894191.1 serine acetyltransferase [Bacteroides sp. ET336]MDN0058688.1 DapH/DapD/GlmU-related protein [Bacteroides caecigallinarum]
MIKTRKDLRLYLNEDIKRNRIKFPLLQKLTYSENYPIYKYIKTLRKYEYYLNNKHWYNIIAYYYYKLLHRRNILKNNIFISPNTIGPGLQIMHPGFRRIGVMAKIGKNCTILPMVLLGKKRPGENSDIIIGDNCYISTGVTILGPINIGNNVTIAAGAVVTKDIPDNCVVGGVPAKIVKFKSYDNEK